MYADLALVHHALQDVVSRNLAPPRKVGLVSSMMNDHGLSEHRACQAVCLARIKQPMIAGSTPDDTWSCDFMATP